MGIETLPADTPEVVLDFDATDSIIHGLQNGRFFNAHYDNYCYLPLYCFIGDIPVWAQLRQSHIDASTGTVEALEKIVTAIRRRCPTARIIVRADSGFCRDKIMDYGSGDITKFPTEMGIRYLAFILDLYSRYVVGWSIADNKTATLVITALVRAVEKRDPPKGFTFHSDHGSQYGSAIFQSVLRFHSGRPSMGSVGDCFDNAVAESFVKTLKTECLSCEQLISDDYTWRLLFEYIEVFYNRKRKHSSLGYMSPYEYESVNRV